MILKEIMKQLPQIDAQFEHKPEPEYANRVLDELLRYYTLDQIALHSGICRRSISYMRHRGFSFPDQIVLEVLSNKRQFADG